MSIYYKILDDENKDKLKYGIIVSDSELISTCIYEAIRCKEFPTIPRNVNFIIRDLNLVIDKEFDEISNFKIKTFKTLHELYQWLEKHIKPLESIKQLNISDYEFNMGIDDIDSERITIKDEKLDDFVDIDAYILNIGHDLLLHSLQVDYRSFN